MLRKSYIYR